MSCCNSWVIRPCHLKLPASEMPPGRSLLVAMQLATFKEVAHLNNLDLKKEKWRKHERSQSIDIYLVHAFCSVKPCTVCVLLGFMAWPGLQRWLYHPRFAGLLQRCTLEQIKNLVEAWDLPANPPEKTAVRSLVNSNRDVINETSSNYTMVHQMRTFVSFFAISGQTAYAKRN